MPRSRPVALLVVVAVLATVLGVLVLQSEGAQDVGVDPYAPASERPWLDVLSAWNGRRGVGAVLVLLGLTTAATVVGLLLGARLPTVPRRPLLVTAVVAAVIVVGGLAVLSRFPEPVVEYEGTYRLLRAPEVLTHALPATLVWTRSQTLGALASAAGLVLGSGTAGVAAAGRRRGPARSPRPRPPI